MQPPLEHDQRVDQQAPHVQINATTPDQETPETRRNGASDEQVTAHEVDPQAQKELSRMLVTLGLEVALALMLTLAARLWGWAREERARARADRALRTRIPAM